MTPGTYTGIFDQKGDVLEIQIIIGENNTASFEDMISTFHGGYFNTDPEGPNAMGTDRLFDSKAEDYESSVILDGIDNIPTYTLHKTVTEEVTEQVPIYTTVDPPETNGEAKNLWIQSGADVGDGMYLTLKYMNSNILGIDTTDVSTEIGAQSAIDTVKQALEKVSEMRSSLGAQQNRLEHTYKNVTNIAENSQASESLIRDTDMAKEMVENSKLGILEQVGTTIMAQANQTKQGVLSLLQ